MVAKRLWAKAGLLILFALTGCQSWCERHYGLQPIPPASSCCTPCAPAYQQPACCCPAPAYSPCAPAPAYAPPPVAPIPAVPGR